MIATQFRALAGEPVQVHLARTVTQYTNIGPMKEPVVLASGDADKITSVAGRVFAGPLSSLLARAAEEVTLYLDFEVVNLTGDRPKTTLLDFGGRIESASPLVLRSRTVKGFGMRLHLDPARILFFHQPEKLTDVPEWQNVEHRFDDGSIRLPPPAILELQLVSPKGSPLFAYVPASEVLFLVTPMAIALV